LIYIFSLLHFSLAFPFGPGSALAQETLIVFTFFSPSFLQSLDLFERGLLQHPIDQIVRKLRRTAHAD